MIKRQPIYYFTAIGILLLLATGCKKFVTITPTTEIDANVIFSGDETANIALIGLYAKMMQQFGLLNGYPSRYGALYADELKPLSPQPSDLPFFQSRLEVEEKVVAEIWITAYNQINQANQTIEKIAKSGGMTEKGKREHSAEAKFIRSIYYYYLVNLLGEVPLILTSRYQESQQVKRTPVEKIYQQVEQDLQDAVAGLPETYPAYPYTGTVPIRATKYAAMSLLARVYLYQRNWQQAMQQSSTVISSGTCKLATDPNDVFRMNSPETILALQPTSTEFNTAEGYYFVYLPAMPEPAFVLTDSLLAVFEPGDKRRTAWARPAVVNGKTVYAPDKYEVYDGGQLKELNIVLRLAELYLVRAEAYAQLGNIQGSMDDINKVRQRAGLPLLPAAQNKTTLLQAIEQERRIELLAEWGHRWFDLRRWPSMLQPADPAKARADDILSKYPEKEWAPWKKLWPIPVDEILKLPALSQNEGYD